MPPELTMKRDKISESVIYRFGQGMEGNAFLTRGWGEPEKGFVWSEGKAAAITIPALAGANVLSISLWGYVQIGKPAQEVMVFVNGLLVDFFLISSKSILRAPLPAITYEESIKIVFYIPSAISPEEAEGLPDKRQLGIALAVVQLESE